MTGDPSSLIGRSVPRREDFRFVTGAGTFTDDLCPHGLLHGFVLRSRWAHGTELGIDARAATAMPGVRLVLTADALAEAGLDCVPVDLPPPGHSFANWSPLAQPVLASPDVRYVGDALAFVVAETLAQATDAGEALQIELTELPPVVDLRRAEPDFVYEEGDAAATAVAFAASASVVRAELLVNRVDAMPIEPRGCIGAYRDGRFTLHVSTQRVQIIQRALADRVFKVPREQVHVIAPDTGGGFGQKNGLYPEYVLCLEAARRLGQPVKWVPDRGDGLSSGCHARDNLFSISASLDRKERITSIVATRTMNMGAYHSSRSMVPVQNGITHLTGVYHVPAAHVRVEGVLTNTAPTCSYRGAGRPENVYACERLIDIIARTLNRDPIAFRRKNLIGTRLMPWTSPLGTRFEGHDFAGLLDRALSGVEYDSFRKRQRKAARAGMLRGIGVCLFAEDLHGSHEPIPARLEWADDRLDLIVGTGSAGHGHETTFVQVAAETLGLPMERFGFRQSDTARMAEGVGTAASWSLTLGGSSVRLAAEAAIDRGREIASTLLEVTGRDIVFKDGEFGVVGTDLSVSWDAIFAAEPAFRAHGSFEGSGQNVPAACHACEVEVDPETGMAEILGYTIVQDSGVVINPMIFRGQLHGGMAQGVGQGWMEQIVYDPQNGQLLSGTLADYALPRASDLPKIDASIVQTRAHDNPLGVKGVGEAAATGSTAAFANAVLDALWPLRILHIDPPFTPPKVWNAIRKATDQSVALPGNKSLPETKQPMRSASTCHIN
jgi:aerobic carbon-monoxide dehydrogenase large subunit